MTKIDKFARLFVGAQGGEIQAISPHGEVAYAIGLTGGRHNVSDYWPDLPPEHHFEVAGTCTVMPQPSRVVAQNMGPIAAESGANPDFVVTAATRAAKQMEQMLNSLNQTEKRMQQKIAHYEQLDARNAERTKEAPIEVIEDDDPIEIEETPPRAAKAAPEAKGADE